MPQLKKHRVVRKRFRFRAAVRLDVADHDLATGRAGRLRGAQHREGFADTSGRAEEDPQTAATCARLVGPDLREQRVGIRPSLNYHGVTSSLRSSVER